MTVRAMTPAEIDAVGETLSYVPSGNVRGLCNGTACILYDQWAWNSVCVHSYIPEPRFLTRGFLREMWRFPFTHVDWVIGVTPGDNTRALAFNKRMGFKEVYRLEDGFAKAAPGADKGVDLVYQTAHYADCKWWRRPT